MAISVEIYKIYENDDWVEYKFSEMPIKIYDEGPEKNDERHIFGYCKFNKADGEFIFEKERSHSYFKDKYFYLVKKVYYKLITIKDRGEAYPSFYHIAS